MEGKQVEYIDLRKVYKRIMENKRKFCIVLPIVFVLSCGLVLCIPRYYITEARVVPEVESSGVGGALGDLASSFGFDFSDMQTSDAITPLLYPDLMEDNGFVASLFDIRVKSNFDDEMPIDTTYYWYMRKFQKSPFWSKWMLALRRMLKKPKQFKGGDAGTYDPYYISELDDGIMENMRGNITIGIDKKTAVISIQVKTQDPIICRTLADSVMTRLQDYITRYRTNKVRVDMEYYDQLRKQAKTDYDEARKLYAEKTDANQGNLLQRVRSELEELENSMQLKYNTYASAEAQYQAAVAKVQARTPVFTVLKEASVPVKHAGPKRMIMVAGLLFLAFLATTAYILKGDILRQIDQQSKK